jgi:hypothetical protein
VKGKRVPVEQTVAVLKRAELGMPVTDIIRQHRSMQHYRSVNDPKLTHRGRMHELAQIRVRYGYRCIHMLLRREGGFWTGSGISAVRAASRQWRSATVWSALGARPAASLSRSVASFRIACWTCGRMTARSGPTSVAQES